MEIYMKLVIFMLTLTIVALLTQQFVMSAIQLPAALQYLMGRKARIERMNAEAKRIRDELGMK